MKTRKGLLPLSTLAIVGILALSGCDGGQTPSSSAGGSSGESPISSLIPEGTKTYTYHDATSGSPEKWAPATWKTSEDTLVSGYTEMGLVNYILNDAKNGYEVIPEMAAEIPTDITNTLTADEAAKYDMNVDEEGKPYTTGQKWDVKLNQAAVFADGTVINADTYINSLKDLLDPEMQNYRAGDYANGQTAIAGGLHYLQSGQTMLEDYIDGDGVAHTGEVTREGWYLNIYDTGSFLGYSIATLAGYLVDDDGEYISVAAAIMDDEATWGTSASPKDVRIDNNEELKNKVFAFYQVAITLFGRPSSLITNDFVEGDVGETFSLATLCKRYYTYDEYEFDNVGIKKVGDYEFWIYFKSPVSDFNAKQFFSGNWIVKQELWDSLRKPVADSGLYSTTYGTSVDTYVSYGPYKLVTFQTDKEFDFDRNERWYGYSDGKHEGTYQVDRIEVQYVENMDTQLSLFRTGKIDGYALRSADLKTVFGSSSRLLYTPQSYTTKMSVNSDFSALKALQDNDTTGNHTILSNEKFRQALSLGLDRKTLCQTQTAGWRGFDVPLNFMYVSDPDTGVAYRETEQGKRVVTENFGSDSDGEPNYFGYDVTEARKLIDEAVKEEDASTREGHYEIGQDVHFVWETYNEGWNDMVNWVVDAYKNLVTGTLLEGKLNIEVKIAGGDYADHLRAGTCDFGISTWGGAQFDPFGVLECYTVSGNMYETYNIYNDYLEINLKTGEWSATKGKLGTSDDVVGMTLGGDGSGNKAGNWTYELNSGKYSSALADSTTRLNILAACESYIVGTYNFVTWGARQSVSIDSYRVQEATDEYVTIVGFGGIRDLKLTKSDDEWASWVSANLGSDGFIDYNK